MDSSANEREGYVMKEYNMEASTERCAGRFQILRLCRSTSDGLQAAPAYAHRKPIDVSLTIWKRAAQATREAALNQRSVRGLIGVSQDSQGRKGIIGIDRKSCFG
jgi:hypothetical protein